MRTRRLGTSDLTVTVVGLGCNNFGRRVDEEGTRAVVDAALDAGVTFFDTADIYGTGESETLLGRILKGRRDRVMLATKFGKSMGDGAERRGRRDYIRAAVDASLEPPAGRADRPLPAPRGRSRHAARGDRRRDQGAGRRGQDARVRDVQLRPGKPRRTAELARALGVPYASEQSEYSWLERDVEAEVLPACERLGLGFIPYFPLASGLLTGKVTREHPPARGNAPLRTVGCRRRPRPRRGAERLGEGARLSLLDVAVGGLAAQPAVVSVIAGATKPEQVRANAKAGEWEPSPAELAELLAL